MPVALDFWYLKADITSKAYIISHCVMLKTESKGMKNCVHNVTNQNF